ncbi:hypothetical protein FDT66_08325 [Polaribacter aestuariivivens]|uniref:DUF3575 domain-containing protein n=1 Tax=Polaribacter aestuariivivens TaxID=2304626 RepID=A0A5S3N8X5_9FLAO|nr:hypothetical protein [Polaribacter aestuariivivens]TMM29869.1 hypothetical protein FDT66_08325 [Polaribacter aestuariivivens]
MIFSSINSQENIDSLKVKTNPIIFTDLNVGYANGALKGISGGISLNYQAKDNLFKFRFFRVEDIEKIEFFLIFPINSIYTTLDEYAFLYGKRYIDDGFSYHFSGGISYNKEKYHNNGNVTTKGSFIGFPLEIGVGWFKSKKERFRVFYGLIPVGKPTGFGRSFGIKLYANIAKKSYVGLGLSVGLGWHKKY